MASVQRLSAQEIMRMSSIWFSKISSEKLIDLSTIQQLFDGTQFGLSREEVKDVELALLLLASAHKIGNKQFDCASKLLNLCHFLSSDTGNSVQRVVHYFTKALQEKIGQETETASTSLSSNGCEIRERRLLYPTEITVGVNPALISCCLKIPCLQLVQFAGIQTVIDSLDSAKKVHFIDLGIKTGGHCTVLMQALANRQECPIELLKISGVGVTASRQRIENAGRSLACFAGTLNLPFSFKSIIVTRIKDLKIEMFELGDGEVVAIFLPSILRFLKERKDYLQFLLRLLRKLNPCVIVIIEPELNHNSTIFMDSFLQVLLFYSTCYSGIEACIKQSDQNRISIEESIGQEVRDIIAAKDEERIIEHMKIDEWRDYFIRFGMVETQVSMSSFIQAELMLKNFACGNSCLLVRNGKCLITGWKDTPLLSVSAWKFKQQSDINSTKKSKLC